MSDEKIFSKEWVINALDERDIWIEKLEQKLEASSASHTEKLESLKDQLFLRQSDLAKLMDKELSELRNQIQNNSIVDLNHYTELKEQFGRHRERHHLRTEYITIEEVLREFLDYEIGMQLKDTGEDSMASGYIRKLLKKLDGKDAGSARQTGEGCNQFVYCSECIADDMICSKHEGKKNPLTEEQKEYIQNRILEPVDFGNKSFKRKEGEEPSTCEICGNELEKSGSGFHFCPNYLNHEKLKEALEPSHTESIAECSCPNCRQQCWKWESLVLVRKEDLQKDFDFLYNKIYRWMSKIRKESDTSYISEYINMIYFYFESRKKKYLSEEPDE